MRIIAGKYRSRIIKMPKGADVRPTKDRIREALFNIIGASIRGAAVLDAFAGSGAFGIEALSRGAGRAVFVDNSGKCVETVMANLMALGIGDKNATVIKMDAFKAIDAMEQKKEKFDIVLLDPPYYGDAAKKSLIKMDRRDILAPHCIIVAEHHKSDLLPEKLDTITAYHTARYGDIWLTFYKADRRPI